MQEQPSTDIKESPQESDLLILGEEKDLQNTDKATDNINEQILGAGAPLYFTSERKKKDLRINSNTKGWLKYWKLRLAGEVDILPDEVGNIVKDWINTKHQPIGNEQSILSIYINRRLEVLNFQIQKQEAMAKLKSELQRIDNRKDSAEKFPYRKVFYDEAFGKMFTYDNGTEKEITWGDIVADGEWEIKYRPDDSVPDNIWRKMRKLSAVKEARRSVENIFNDELSAVEHVPQATTSWTVDYLEKKLKSFTGISGPIAEKMAQGFLIRIGYANSMTGLKVEHSNALEDTVLKYDFKVVFSERTRGVAVEGEEMPREEYVKEKSKLGIQFTTKSSVGKKIGKINEAKEKISDERLNRFIKKPVDDIILVSLPFGTYKQYFEKWISEGKPSGGPVLTFRKVDKIALLKKITENALNLSDKEMGELVQ